MAGLTPLFTIRDVQRWTDNFKDRAEEKLEKTLTYIGERFVAMARDRGPEESFRDITGNLRSSISYIVVKDGKILCENFQRSRSGTEGNEGVNKARRLASVLARTHIKGFVLIGMAGMDYAIYVENMENKDVISSPEVAANKELKILLKQILNGR